MVLATVYLVGGDFLNNKHDGAVDVGNKTMALMEPESIEVVLSLVKVLEVVVGAVTKESLVNGLRM